MPATRTEPAIILIGPMGAGKSAVGRQLARQLGRDFLDTDAEIERRTGVDIPFIFEKEGEKGFRVREARVVEDLTALPGIVLATGGGVVVDPANRAFIGRRGLVIYLHASIGQQLARTRRSRNRPLLATDDPRSLLQSLMAVREPLYRALASHVVNTDGRKVRDVAGEIRAWVESREGA